MLRLDVELYYTKVKPGIHPCSVRLQPSACWNPNQGSMGFVLDPTQSEQEQLLVHFIHVSNKCYKSIIKLFYFTTQFLLPTAMSACILCVLQNSIKSDFICIFFFLMVWIIMQSVSIHTPTTKHRKTNASFSMYNYNNIIIFHLLLHCVGLSKTHCFLLNGL